MRRLLGTGAAIALAAIAAPAAQAGPVTPVPGLPADALTVMNQPAYASAQWFVSVRDLATGASVVSLKANELAEPGSVVKTYSMGAGWQHFGPDSRVVTPVKRTGTMSGSTLDGNLILVGQGDMTMDGRTKPDGTVDFANLDHNAVRARTRDPDRIGRDDRGPDVPAGARGTPDRHARTA